MLSTFTGPSPIPSPERSNVSAEAIEKGAGPPAASPAAGGSARRKILFVCAQNQIRSRAAENLLAGSSLYAVRSRGVARSARIRLGAPDIAWADLIFVMEKEHKIRILDEFSEALVGKPVICLFIKDRYRPMEPALIAKLVAKLAPHLVLPPSA